MLDEALFCVYSGGEYRAAMWVSRGGPMRLGARLLGFLSTMDRDTMATALRERVAAVTEWQVPEHPPALAGADPIQRLQAVHDSSPADTFAFHHELECVGDSYRLALAYVIDLDAGTFEVFQGGNTTMLTEGDRFFEFAQELPDFYPVRLRRAWPLDALPTDEELRRLDPEAIRTLPQPRPATSSALAPVFF